MSARVTLQPGYVLSSRAYRDTSLLLEVFTPDHGRVGLVARGARAPRSRLRGQVQSFTPLLLTWRASGELGALDAVESSAPPVPLSGERVFYGWYLNELLLCLLQRHDAHPVLYATYATLLPFLQGDEAAAQRTLRVFEKRLLAEIGYGLMLPAQLAPELAYHYDWERGPQEAAPDTVGAISGRSLIALRDEVWPDDVSQQQARRLLRAALARQLGGRVLRTPQLLRQMRANGGG